MNSPEIYLAALFNLCFPTLNVFPFIWFTRGTDWVNEWPRQRPGQFVRNEHVNTPRPGPGPGLETKQSRSFHFKQKDIWHVSCLILVKRMARYFPYNQFYNNCNHNKPLLILSLLELNTAVTLGHFLRTMFRSHYTISMHSVKSCDFLTQTLSALTRL